jgi:hypothetical protein
MLGSRVVTGVAVVAAVAAGGVGGALIGVPGLSGAQPFPKNAVSAAATDAKKNTDRVGQKSALLDAAAKALGLTTKQLTDKLSDGKTTIADVATQQKVDLNKVIDAMASADRDRISAIVNEPWPKFGAPGERAKDGVPGLHGLFGRLGDVALDPVAKALGITPAELKTDLGNGQSIADIAKAKKVDLNKVIDSLVADASAKIDQAVKAGHLDQAMADKIKSGLRSTITDLVNGSLPKDLGPKGGGWFGGRRGHGHFGAGVPTPGSTTPTTKAPTS